MYFHLMALSPLGFCRSRGWLILLTNKIQIFKKKMKNFGLLYSEYYSYNIYRAKKDLDCHASWVYALEFKELSIIREPP